ncbi:uncharacterized protein LOC106629733 isoform X2 [Zonotrichia albicollis]|uniref:uncharacterized protein LOC106629733 isoform X2 n=1 Tax=Zonotrichia albicollis TaxID=44394 RepID=UPI003D80ED99
MLAALAEDEGVRAHGERAPEQPGSSRPPPSSAPRPAPRRAGPARRRHRSAPRHPARPGPAWPGPARPPGAMGAADAPRLRNRGRAARARPPPPRAEGKRDGRLPHLPAAAAALAPRLLSHTSPFSPGFSLPPPSPASAAGGRGRRRSCGKGGMNVAGKHAVGGRGGGRGRSRRAPAAAGAAHRWPDGGGTAAARGAEREQSPGRDLAEAEGGRQAGAGAAAAGAVLEPGVLLSHNTAHEADSRVELYMLLTLCSLIVLSRDHI